MSNMFYEGLNFLNPKLAKKLLNYEGMYLTVWIIEGPVGMPKLNQSGVKHWALGFEFSDLDGNGNVRPNDTVCNPPVVVIEIYGAALVHQNEFNFVCFALNLH